jgi:melanoma-associated antigen
MTLTELPLKEKITTSQKRAAQRAHGNSQGAASSSKAYILTSTLPSSLRTPAILPPSKVPSMAAESSYTGLYTFIVSVIYLTQGGRIGEGKLERILTKMNAGINVLGGEKTDKVLKRMEREGYIVKIREREAGGEETVEWTVGPRGKVEIGERGVAGLVCEVYGKRDEELEELEARLEKSLGKGTFGRKTRSAREVEDDGEAEQGVTTGAEDGGPRESSNRPERGPPGRPTQRMSLRSARRATRGETEESANEDEGEEDE